MKIIIIGSSAAGMSAAKTIREHDQKCEIAMITADDGYYSRVQLHLVASGNRAERQVYLAPAGWEKLMGVNLIPGKTVIGMDPASKTVRLDDNSVHHYDKLLIATGARTQLPPVTGIQGPGVYGLRNLDDAVAVRETLAEASEYVIIGAGLVGVELALELAKTGKKVSVVEMAPHPLPMQLEEETGAMCAEVMRQAGVNLYCGQLAGEIIRGADGKPQAVLLKSGARIDADVVVAAAGVRSNMDFAVAAGIKSSRGIVINERCETSIPDVYAAGDVAETMDTLMNQVIPSAIWPTAVRQGKVAALNILGMAGALERNTGFKASVVLHKTPVISLGPVYKINPDWEKRVFRSTSSDGKRSVKIFFLHEGILKAALLWGDITNAGLYFESIVNKRPLETDMPHLDQLDAAKRGSEKLEVL